MTMKKNVRGAGAGMGAALSATSAVSAAAISAALSQRGESMAALGLRQVAQVISKQDGFRRAGRSWSGTTTVPLDELSPDQLEKLQNEPKLVVLILDVPEEDVEALTAADAAPEGSAGQEESSSSAED